MAHKQIEVFDLIVGEKYKFSDFDGGNNGKFVVGELMCKTEKDCVFLTEHDEFRIVFIWNIIEKISKEKQRMKIFLPIHKTPDFLLGKEPYPEVYHCSGAYGTYDEAKESIFPGTNIVACKFIWVEFYEGEHDTNLKQQINK